jgi:hypothetical protein
MALQKDDPTFDDVVLNITPSLKNGVAPENQTVLEVLEEVAIRVGEERWRLNPHRQQHLFENS